MSAAIEIYPPEVVENIVQNLPLEDIANVRLCSRSMAALSTQETFKSFFLAKKVNLTRGCLERFIHITTASSLACLVEKLTIAGVAVDVELQKSMVKDKVRWDTTNNGPIFSSIQTKLTEDGVAEAENNLAALRALKSEQGTMRRDNTAAELLARAFQNIRGHRKHGRLLSLTLTVVVFRKDAEQEQQPKEKSDEVAIWQAAADCFQSTMQAIGKSHLPVDELDVFNSTLRCSMALDSVDDLLKSRQSLNEILEAVKVLRISLSERPDDKSEDVDHPRNMRTKDYDAILRLLELFPNLQTLEMHWYNARSYRLAELASGRPDLLEYCTKQEVNLKSLNTLVLRGAAATGQSLLRFLQSVPAKSVSLAEFHIIDERFTSILEYCTSDEAGLEHVSFDDMWEPSLVYFDGMKSKFPVLGGSRGGQTLERRGPEVRKPIQYHFAQRPLGSPAAYRWHTIKQAEYGPP
ncbi:hypothetical protein LTR09_000741 [Extremus antarcticus]|uniref:F-box domain-containing protein n=1 Tax=Extremus antarcticus TaxID=702011 RepID=A0AAJ0LXM9_9PEZI|nr:hypothetical protein LTR09_000741 [Extremus antarcticus]